MRFLAPLLLLAPLSALSVINVGSLGISPPEQPTVDEGKGRFGTLSPEHKAQMQKDWGFDPEIRRSRLSSLLNKPAPAMTSQQKKELDEALAKIVPIKTEKPAQNESADLFEANLKSGVSEYLFQGDMHLTDSQLDKMEQKTRGKRQASTFANKWPEGNVYYCFDESIGNNDPCGRKTAAVYEALYYLTTRTCFNFIQNCTAPNRIRVMSGTGCYSSIGMTGGVQDLSLGDGCESVGTVAHEFMHALGVWHMQQRSDRDKYVTINTADVPKDMQGNFEKLDESENFLFTNYEYGSTMHYPANAFTRSGSISIVAKDPRFAYTMGNKYISFQDVKILNELYKCKSWCANIPAPKCQNGGYQNPRNPTTCNCPEGYGGTLCNQRPEGCGEKVTATKNWQTKEIRVGKENDKSVRAMPEICNHWIIAPPDMQIQVKIVGMANSQCQFGCPFNGIEPKVMANPQVTNPRYCCQEFNNQILTSFLNPTPIIAYNRFLTSSFTIQYRFIDPKNPPAPGITATVPTTTVTVESDRNCRNLQSDEYCETSAKTGICTNTNAPWAVRKYNCAKTCGMCGKAASPCVDNEKNCSLAKCSTMDPMDAEYSCAKTCGFCTRPN